MTTGLLITALGQAAIIADLGGGTDLVLTHVAWGDANGVPYNPSEAQTALVNERYRATIASVAVVDGAIVVDAIIPADTPDGSARPSHGFNVAEVGLFNSTGTMIGVARLGNGYKPPPSTGQATIATFRLKLSVANPSAITVIIDPQAQIILGRQVRPYWLTVDGVLNAPPASPADGATYVIGSTPTGAWAGFAHRLAQWVGVWSLATVPEGHNVVDRSKAIDDANRHLRRSDTGWAWATASETAFGVTQHATAAETQAGTSNTLSVTPAGLAATDFSLAQLMRLGFCVVESATVTAPPGSPAVGRTHVVPTGATGAWAGQDNKLTQWNGAAWVFADVPTGFHVVDQSKGVDSGARWVERTASGWASGLTRLIQKQPANFATVGGTANALTVTLDPAPAALSDLIGVPLRLKIVATNTAAATLNPNTLGAGPITRPGGAALQPGDLSAGAIVTLIPDGTQYQMAGLSQNLAGGSLIVSTPGVTNWVVPAGVTRVMARIWGGGGGGGGATGVTAAGAGAGGGEYREGVLSVTPGATIALTVGAGGTGTISSAPSGTRGTTGGSTSVGALMTAIGGQGGSVGAGFISSANGVGGTGGSGGSFAQQGTSGGTGYTLSGSAAVGGVGGASFGTSISQTPVTSGGFIGADPGGGGSGASAAASGGTGGRGLIILEW